MASRTANHNRMISAALANLTNRLIDKGIDPAAATRFARIALSANQGVRIGKGGLIHYKGNQFTAAKFADSPLIDYITGQKAKLANQHAIEADPQYQATLAQAGLQRDQQIAADDAQRRSALIDSGYAQFVAGDPILQAAVKANPFSTSRLEADSYARNQAGALQDATALGTRFGGGYLAARQEALRQHAGNEAQNTTTLTNLLSNILQDQTGANQQYDVTHANALLQGQQTLTANGTAVNPPKGLKPGTIKWWNPPKPAGGRGNTIRDTSGQPPNLGPPRHPPAGGGPRPPAGTGSPHGAGQPGLNRVLPQPAKPLIGVRWHRRRYI